VYLRVHCAGPIVDFGGNGMAGGLRAGRKSCQNENDQAAGRHHLKVMAVFRLMGLSEIHEHFFAFCDGLLQI
jgi:hypothetical protein